MSFVTDDLRYAQTAQVAVEMMLLTGEKIFSGVQDIDADEGFVSVYAPLTFEDKTTRKIGLDLIASVAVTDVDYRV